MDYQSNSHRMKEEAEKASKEPPPEKNLVKIVTGEVVVKKKPFGYKFKSIFFGGEFKEVVGYITYDVVLPGARDIFFDTIRNGAHRMIYGRSGGYSGRRDAIPVRSRVQYNNPVRRFSDPRMPPPITGRLPDQPPTGFRQNRREANDILLVSREEADQVLETLTNCVEMYGVVSLADLYELIGHPQATIDQKWGWTYLTSASIKSVRDGYLLELPPLEEI
jgi:hypothetical protein